MGTITGKITHALTDGAFCVVTVEVELRTTRGMMPVYFSAEFDRKDKSWSRENIGETFTIVASECFLVHMVDQEGMNCKPERTTY